MLTSAKGVPVSASLASGRWVPLLAFCLVMVDGYDSLMISFVAPVLPQSWNLDAVSVGLILAAGYAGAAMGGMIVGPLADRFGRKPALLASLAVSGLATCLCAFATGATMLVVLRLVAGLALGGALPSLISITAESARPEKRGGTVTLMFIGYPFGAVVGGLITAAFLWAGWSDVFLAAGLVSLVAMGLALLLPETLRPLGSDASLPSGAAGTARMSFAQQFADGRLLATLFMWLGFFCTLLVTYFLVSWTPFVLVKAGLPPQAAAVGGVVLNLGGVVGALAVAPVINRAGPFVPVAVMVGISAILIGSFGSAAGSMPVALGILFLCGVFLIGSQISYPAIGVELFPQPVRAAGAGWALGVGRTGSILGPLIGAWCLHLGVGLDRLFEIAAVPAIVSCVAVSMVATTRPRHVA